MIKKFVSCLLAVAITLTGMTFFNLFTPTVSAVEEDAVTSRYFYEQLKPEAQAIYNVLYDMYKDGDMRNGETTVDLVEKGAVSEEALNDYIAGDRTLADDFAAAKDAFDLDWSSAWYVDSSYLSLRTGLKSDGKYAAYLGTGRSSTYLLPGLTADKVDEMDSRLNDVIDEIVNGAKQLDLDGLSESDADAHVVKYVHDAVTKRISYRFENECKDGNSPYVRTIYALVTHEGVCESYARSMQVILTKLGITCVLVHGIQKSGDAPEMHMWNEVQIGGKWYAVDATWDDPVKYDKETGKLVDGVDGNDGREHQTYLLVGLETIGQDWVTSGIVSGGNFEFTYPQIEVSSYSGDVIYGEKSGLHVSYTAMAYIEGAPAGQFKVDFNGKGVMKTADEDGLYLLIKMYDEHNDGTQHSMTDWYYAAAALFFLTHDNASKYFYDSDNGFYLCTATCEYVEFALTTRAPDNYGKYATYEEWCQGELFDNASGASGFYNGDGSDILAQTDKLYNAESKYEAAPYVLSQIPAGNRTHTAGVDYHVEVHWDDVLYHPAGVEDKGPVVNGRPEISAAAEQEDDRPTALTKDVRVRYISYQLDRDGATVESTLSIIPDWDKNNDHYVDNVKFSYMTDICPHRGEKDHVCSWDQGCPIDGVEFDFKGSDKWADDVTLYTFVLEGVVGSRSYRVPNNFEISIVCPGQCPACYRSYGIDWNLWGMPTLLDNPGDLNLDEVVMQGVDGKRESLAELQKEMKVDDLNGRLTLVVEPIGKEDGMSRTKYEEVSGAFSEHTEIPDEAIKSSSMYEITFTRICKMIMLKTGQSLRMQLGFPQGYDADSVRNNEVVFKAYHFTRCSADNPCDNENKPGHHYGDDIISVEEIPLAVTEYGLVILCDSFSPFEIVALDASLVSEDSNIKNNNIIVKTDGNGTVFYDGVETVGADGFISFEEGQTRTFRVEAKEGYIVDVVSFGKRTIAVGADGTFTLSYDEMTGSNDMLNVSFVPITVKEEEEANGVTTVVPNVEPSEPAHVHEFGDWQYDDEHHYRECACKEKDGYGEHTFVDGVCTVCGAKAKTQDNPPTGDDNPPTGDTLLFAVWLSLAAGAVTTLAVFARSKRKKSNNL